MLQVNLLSNYLPDPDVRSMIILRHMFPVSQNRLTESRVRISPGEAPGIPNFPRRTLSTHM